MYKTPSPNPDQLHSAVSRKRNRNRGVMLSELGWQKLAQAGALHDKWGNRYTYETLSERSLLNERTISRTLSGEVKVDKRSLRIFFAAFGLQLGSDDYTTASQPITSLHYLNLTVPTVEANESYQELTELYQRLMQDLRHLSHLLNLDEVSGSTQLQATKLN